MYKKLVTCSFLSEIATFVHDSLPRCSGFGSIFIPDCYQTNERQPRVFGDYET